MAAQVRNGGRAFVLTALGVATTEQGLGPGLVHGFSKGEGLGWPPVALADIAADGPAGEDQRQLLHVALVVATIDAEGMQFEQLAGVVLIEATAVVPPGAGIGPDRADLIEVDQHRRVTRAGLHHVLEAAEDVRADGLALVGAGGQGHDRLASGADREVVRPEPHQPLGKGGVGGHGVTQRRASLETKGLAAELTQVLARGGFVVAGAVFHDRLDQALGAGQISPGQQRSGWADLAAQPRTRVDRPRLSGAGAEAKAVQGA